LLDTSYEPNNRATCLIRNIKMKKLIAITLFICSYSYADQASIDSIEQAFMQLNSQQLIQLSNQSEGYDKALAYYRLAVSQNLQAKPQKANASLEQAITLLEEITSQSENNDEAWALLAQVYGLKIAYEPMKGAYYGPKSGQALSKALAINNENPRTHLVLGISKYNTPTMFGGSKEAALKALNKAISLYSDSQASDIRWGKAEAYVWRGLTQLELGQKEQALNDWQTALSIEPNYGWAQMLSQQNQ